MARVTLPYNPTFAGSVGSGIGAVLGNSGRRYYVLEHKQTSRYHRAGESQQIIVDQIELGRDSRCQVRFDDSFETVSRRHAAIVRVGDGWKLVQLSQTNSTLLNGNPIQQEFPLQNGDEIQLSINGPKLGFIAPSGKTGSVITLGLTNRLNLFRKQALSPYKKAIWALVVLLLLIAGGSSFWGWHEHKEITSSKETIDSLNVQVGKVDSLENVVAGQLKTISGLKTSVRSIKNAVNKQANQIKEQSKDLVQNSDEAESSPIAGNDEMTKLSTSVYYIRTEKVEVLYKGETQTFPFKTLSTGFLLDDGRFVTARHCVEPWLYPQGDDVETIKTCLYISAMDMLGARIKITMYAFSNDGSQSEFSNLDFVCDRKNDTSRELMDEEGNRLAIKCPGGSDWAYMRTEKKGTLKAGSSISRDLKLGEKVFILGYPHGLGAEADVSDQRNMQPLFAQSIVARNGLTEQNQIYLTSRSFEGGNSGGPVLVKRDGRYYVVAIVSSGSETLGFVTPICLIYNQ